MIDLHSHVLAGIDDGPETVDGSLAILRAAEAAGITTIVATPHVSSRYPNDAGSIAAAAALLRASLPEPGPAVRVVLGAEVAITRVAELEAEELAALRLGDGPWLLIEPPFSTVARGLDSTIADLHRNEHRVLLAHPERCPAFQRDPALLEALVDAGALCSLTAGSLVGRFGGQVRRFALDLLEAELIHNVASDAHDAGGRAPGMAQELRAAGVAELQDWLTWEVPAAILDGGAIPRRPPVTIARRGGRRWPWGARR